MKRKRNERDVADGVSNKEKKPSGFTDLVDLEEFVTRGLLDIVRELLSLVVVRYWARAQDPTQSKYNPISALPRAHKLTHKGKTS